MSTDELVPCIDCGHAHFSNRRGYLPCPVQGCDCPQVAGDPIHQRT